MGTHYKGSDKDENTLDAYIKLMRASDSITARLNKHLGEHDLTLSQFGVMEALHHLGPLNQRALGEKLLKSGGNITMVIDNLEKCGWVMRKRNPEDRRSVLIHLTDDGKEFIESFFPRHLEKINEEFAPLTEEEKKKLGELCKKIGKKPTSQE